MSEPVSISSRSERGKTRQDLLALEVGKLSPQATDIEEAVLGACMLEITATMTAISILSPDAFYKEAHQKIFKAIGEMYYDGGQIDILTVTQRLKKNGDLEFIGGPFYISQLTNRVGSTANVEAHCRIIAQKFLQREIIRISNSAIKGAYEETTDVFDLMEEVQMNLQDIHDNIIKGDSANKQEVINSILEEIKLIQKNPDMVAGEGTGLSRFDQVVGGFLPGNLITLAARPGVGKTAFVIASAHAKSVVNNIPTLIISCEMSEREIVTRLLAYEYEVLESDIRQARLSEEEIEKIGTGHRVANAPVYIVEARGVGTIELRGTISKHVRKYGIKMAYIDYLQLIKADTVGRNATTEEKISSISSSLKVTAALTRVPVIMLAQLSRKTDERPDQIPILSDLKGSGAIEADSDFVGLLWRPYNHGMVKDKNGKNVSDLFRIINEKFRGGKKVDKIDLVFDNDRGVVLNAEPELTGENIPEDDEDLPF